MATLGSSDMVPKEWHTTTLEALATVERGKFSARPRNDPQYYGGSIPFVQTGDVSTSGMYLKRHSQTLNERGLAVSRLFPASTILVTIAANIGDVAIAPYEVAFPDSVVGVQARPDKCDPIWLYYYLLGSKDRLDKRATQNAQKNINLEVLRPLLVAAPPLQEQRQIAQVISFWDRAIETTERLIANSERQKHALMRLLLTGKKRIPGFTGNWNVAPLGEIFDERVERGSEGLQLLSVTQSQGIIPQDKAGRRNISSSDLSKYKVVRIGDIAYNTMRMWQGASALSSYEGIVSPAYTVIKPKSGHSAEFYSYLFKFPKTINTFERHSQGLVSDTWNLKFPALSGIRLRIPSDFKEQIAIAIVLANNDAVLAAETMMLERLRKEHSALAQLLLTGKCRVTLDKEKAA